MSNLTATLRTPEKSDNKNSLIKLLVFEIGKLTLALPILQVQKVIKHHVTHGSGLSHVNLAHLADQDIAIVDLHQKLFKIRLIELSQMNGYFVISKNVTGESIGIMVAESPIIVDVAATQIRLIPESYRQADTLEIASHVAVISQETKEPLTIFILDLERLI